MGPNLSAISYYLPDETLNNQEINQRFPEWDIEKISSKTGISSRHLSAKQEFSSDMAVKVSEIFFSEHSINREEIDFLLLCTQSPDYFLPTTACLVQDRLNLPTSVGALDFNLGCSGYVYGLGLAKGLVYSGLAKNVLLLTSETYTKFIHPRDKSNLTIFGDAASASLISSERNGGALGDFVFGTDGRGGKNLMVKEGGLRFPMAFDANNEVEDEFGNVYNPKNLYMNGSEIFNFTIESVPDLVLKILAKSSLTMDEIDLVIFHQANRYMLNHLRKKLKIDESKFFIYMEHCGNTVSSTIPIALKEAERQGKVQNGNKILLVGFGVGYSWGACVIQY